jgi:hypothetical protein
MSADGGDHGQHRWDVANGRITKDGVQFVARGRLVVSADAVLERDRHHG